MSAPPPARYVSESTTVTDTVAVHDLVDAFGSRHVDCRMTLVDIGIWDPYGPLRRGEIDVLCNWQVVDEADLTCGPIIAEHPRVLMVGSRHRLATKTTVSVEDLAGETLNGVPAGYPSALEDALHPPRTPSGRPIHRSPPIASPAQVFNLVARGELVSPAQAGMRPWSERPGIVQIPFADLPPLPLGLIWCTDHENERIRALAKFATAGQRDSHNSPDGRQSSPADITAVEGGELRALLILADELHFARTAEKLGLTSSRASQLIRKLETRIGAPHLTAPAAEFNSPRWDPNYARNSGQPTTRSSPPKADGSNATNGARVRAGCRSSTVVVRPVLAHASSSRIAIVGRAGRDGVRSWQRNSEASAAGVIETSPMSESAARSPSQDERSPRAARSLARASVRDRQSQPCHETWVPRRLGSRRHRRKATLSAVRTDLTGRTGDLGMPLAQLCAGRNRGCRCARSDQRVPSRRRSRLEHHPRPAGLKRVGAFDEEVLEGRNALGGHLTEHVRLDDIHRLVTTIEHLESLRVTEVRSTRPCCGSGRRRTSRRFRVR